MKKTVLKSYVLSLVICMGTLEAFANKPRSMNEIMASGELVIGIDGESPPYNFYEGTEPKGFEVDLGRAIADKLKLKPVFKQGAFKAMILGLQNGTYDAILVHHTISDERKKAVHFVSPFFCSGSAWYTNDPKLTDLKSIGNASVAFPVGMVYGDLIKKEAPQVEFKTLNSEIEAFQYVNAGKAQIWVTDEIIGDGILKKNPESKIKKRYRFVTDVMGILVAHNEDKSLPEWSAHFEKTYQGLVKDKTYAKLAKQYFGRDTSCLGK